MSAISSNELRELYLSFFESKRHVRIPSAPIVPADDPSVLFTTAGMHPLVPYLKGQPHPQGKRLTDVQKCLRTTDIDEVGDATHATVFEMLGNWSLGDYFKKEAITFSWEFLTGKNWLGLDPNYLAVSVFGGEVGLPKDEQSADIWREVGLPAGRIAYLDLNENWWPAGGRAIGPQGPDTEMFYWVGKGSPPAEFDAKDDRWVEIWNDVFMEFNRPKNGELGTLPQKNVDTGMGLERTVMVLGDSESIYEIDTMLPVVRLIDERVTKPDERHRRIVADHIKAATFVLGDEVPTTPSNTERGYVLRRIIRRAVRSARVLGIEGARDLLLDGLEATVDVYGQVYTSLSTSKSEARAALGEEVDKFEVVLERGLKRFKQSIEGELDGNVLTGKEAFRLYETYGFPIELTVELAREQKMGVDLEGFEVAMIAHRDTSRSAAQGRFAGGLADHSEQSVRYHTATHLLHQALRDVLGDHVEQRGSNITAKRLRFDFSHPTKLTDDERSKVEEIVNDKIAADLEVTAEVMTVDMAQDAGALGLFEHKYADKVSVYSIGDYSCEICGGPHVKTTGDLGNFSITKEESAGAGVRRIKALLD